MGCRASGSGWFDNAHGREVVLGTRVHRGAVIARRIRSRFGVDLPLRAVLDGPSVAALARRIPALQPIEPGTAARPQDREREWRRVEAVLRRHRAVGDVAVRSHAVSNEERVAYVVARAGATIDSDELRRFCRARLPTPTAPGAIVMLTVLPRNAAGQIDRSAPPRPDIWE